MEVLKSGVFDANTYYLTRNFLGADTWLRTREDRTLVSYDPSTQQESALVAFDAAEGATYKTSIDPCSSTANIISRSMKTRLPVGQFDNLLAINYPPGVCADAGLATEQYLPSIGLAQRTRQTIAGPVTYDLTYARIGGVIVISAPEVTFSLTLDSAVYESSQVGARLTLRVVQPEPLRLSFRTAQEFELVVKNEAALGMGNVEEAHAALDSIHDKDDMDYQAARLGLYLIERDYSGAKAFAAKATDVHAPLRRRGGDTTVTGFERRLLIGVSDYEFSLRNIEGRTTHRPGKPPKGLFKRVVATTAGHKLCQR
jgi:hypothetical protein